MKEDERLRMQPEVVRVKPLEQIATPELMPEVQVMQGTWQRNIPKHYQLEANKNGRELCQAEVTVNIVMTDGEVFVSDDPKATFEDVFATVKSTDPALFETLLLPGGTAKSASDANHRSPIQALIQDYAFPGESEREGWDDRDQGLQHQGRRQILGAQMNGLFFNRKSGLVTSEGRILADPDASLAERMAQGMSREDQVKYGINERSLKRPLILLATIQGGKMRPIHFTFTAEETYAEGMERLQRLCAQEQVVSAVAGSPPFVMPDAAGNPRYVPMQEALAEWAANDTRHYIYSPYKGASLFFPELSRLQGIDPARIVDSLSGREHDRVTIPLKESLGHFDPQSIRELLDSTGYKGRYDYDEGAQELHINLLEGVYAHLIPAVTKEGRFLLMQTSGTHGNVTGNDGPTYKQALAIIKDINAQPPFAADPIVAAFSGSQGNDVPDVWVAGRNDAIGRLHHLAPQVALPSRRPEVPRGKRTTPQVAVVI